VTSCRATSFGAPCRELAVYFRPSTVASANHTQAEFGVRDASSGQHVTVIAVIGSSRTTAGARLEQPASERDGADRGELDRRDHISLAV